MKTPLSMESGFSLSLSERCVLTGLLLAASFPVTGMAQGMLVSQRTVSAEAHQATIETVRQVTDLRGQTVLVTNRYVELATGLHRKSADTGQWVRASDTIEEFDLGFVAILGDPTLRMNPPMPVSNLSASLNGSTATLTWDPGSADDTIYYVYRSDSGLDGFGLPLEGTKDTTFVEEDAAGGTMYQVRVCRLAKTGSGSYWDLSQVVFVELN